MNKYQLSWASLHDWFHCATFANSSDGWCVIVKDYVGNDSNQLILREFFDFMALRAWAGY